MCFNVALLLKAKDCDRVFVGGNPIHYVDTDGLNPGPIDPGEGPFGRIDITSGYGIIDNTVLGIFNTFVNTSNFLFNRLWPVFEFLGSDDMIALTVSTPPTPLFPDDLVVGIIAGMNKSIRGAECAAKISVNTTEAVLREGYYYVNGFKYSKYYFEKLWRTGRGGSSLVAKEILKATGGKGVPDALKSGFVRLEAYGWELVYNPTTKEIWHIQPKRK